LVSFDREDGAAERIALTIGGADGLALQQHVDRQVSLLLVDRQRLATSLVATIDFRPGPQAAAVPTQSAVEVAIERPGTAVTPNDQGSTLVVIGVGQSDETDSPRVIGSRALLPVG